MATAQRPLTDYLEFVSPLVTDDYAEYRDDAAIKRLCKHRAIKESTRTFWPRGGPQWDGLAFSPTQNIFLFEAKSHIRELVGGGCAASKQSRAQIDRALAAVKQHCGVSKEFSWTGQFYQHANRLAHLYWFRVVQRYPAHLVYVLFTGDQEMRGPATEQSWRGAIELMEHSMGLAAHSLRPFIHYVFVDLSELNRNA